jgi:hypothetical protein
VTEDNRQSGLTRAVLARQAGQPAKYTVDIPVCDRRSFRCSFVRPWPGETPKRHRSAIPLPRFVVVAENRQYITTHWNQHEWRTAGGYVGLGGPDSTELSRGILAEAARTARELIGPEPPISTAFLIEPNIRSAMRLSGGFDLRDALDLEHQPALDTVGDQHQTGGLIAPEVLFAGIRTDLIAELARNPRLLHQLHWRRFEELIAELLARSGFDVELTSGSRDRGVDIYAARYGSFGSTLYVVECKRYALRRGIGPGLVRQLYGVVEREKATQGLLVTTSFFTKGAVSEQQDLQFRLRLRDYWDIRSWLKTSSQTDSSSSSI